MPRKKASTTTQKRTTKRSAPAKRTRRGPGRPATKKTTMKRGPRGGTPKQPFSLILDPEELSALKKMARQQGTSVASIIRQALHTVIFRSNPELAKTAIENEVNSFLDHMGNKLPLGQTGARRSRIKKQLVTGLMGGMKKR
ncbi:MAG: ribbon-helix-helix protein, CopG family [candidate division Zixibacteria bacterium]|nr:ribbon-helix-helix protein, CopG family [candidate division Zixibacteria bacterium]